MMKKEPPAPVKNRGGRPSREQAGRLEDKILHAAAALFFHEGYGAVSIEKIAKHAQISKRTFYARFENKAVLFRAVVRRIIQHLRPPDDATDRLFQGALVEDILHRIALLILRASLSPDTLALQRLVLAEATRFPELALILQEQGARQEAIHRIAALLRTEKKDKPLSVDPLFAAEQFLVLLTAAPQRRAMLGTPLTEKELEIWSKSTVALFLKGVYR